MKNILVLFGSPRREGNTHYIVSQVLKDMEGQSHIDWLHVPLLDISPCMACGCCEGTGACVFDDDMNIVLEKVKAADIVLVCSPLYFNSVSAQLKILIDRFQSVYEGKKDEGFKQDWSIRKNGFLLCTAGSEHADILGAKVVVGALFLAINAQYSGELFINNTDHISVKDNQQIGQFANLLRTSL